MWDAENRLVAMYPASPDANDIKVAFSYDYQGRRVGKKVYTWDVSDPNDPQWVLSYERKFIWSGWLMLMELDGGDNPVRKYTWGLDLAGQSGSVNSLESAGGIGGLLAVQDPDDDGDPYDPNDFELNYVYAYDGNGNVGQLVKWELGYGSYWGDWHADRMVARYEYDPYGNPRLDIADANESGPYAGENPFRFSTKYWDDETGLGYWGKRYRDGERWISRDPIGEWGGWNLYVYVENAPSNAIDPRGRLSLPIPYVPRGPISDSCQCIGCRTERVGWVGWVFIGDTAEAQEVQDNLHSHARSWLGSAAVIAAAPGRCVGSCGYTVWTPLPVSRCLFSSIRLRLPCTARVKVGPLHFVGVGMKRIPLEELVPANPFPTAPGAGSFEMIQYYVDIQKTCGCPW